MDKFLSIPRTRPVYAFVRSGTSGNLLILVGLFLQVHWGAYTPRTMPLCGGGAGGVINFFCDIGCA